MSDKTKEEQRVIRNAEWNDAEKEKVSKRLLSQAWPYEVSDVLFLICEQSTMEEANVFALIVCENVLKACKEYKLSEGMMRELVKKWLGFTFSTKAIEKKI